MLQFHVFIEIWGYEGSSLDIIYKGDKETALKIAGLLKSEFPGYETAKKQLESIGASVESYHFQSNGLGDLTGWPKLVGAWEAFS